MGISVMNSKIRGYLYEVVEFAPGDGEWQNTRYVSIHDRLEDATKVLEVLESVNYSFTCYGLIMRPVWEDEKTRREEREKACDHNGSTTSVSTRGDFLFRCPKCGMHRETLANSWDANGSPVTSDGNPF